MNMAARQASRHIVETPWVQVHQMRTSVALSLWISNAGKNRDAGPDTSGIVVDRLTGFTVVTGQHCGTRRCCRGVPPVTAFRDFDRNTGRASSSEDRLGEGAMGKFPRRFGLSGNVDRFRSPEDSPDRLDSINSTNPGEPCARRCRLLELLT